MFFPSYSLMLLGLLIDSFPPLFSLDAYLVTFELFHCCFIFLKRDVRAQLGHWRTATIHRSTEHGCHQGPRVSKEQEYMQQRQVS